LTVFPTFGLSDLLSIYLANATDLVSLITVGALCASLSLWGCRQQANNNRVIVYCSVDDVYAGPVLASLAKRTGLDIEPLYDVESAKAAGLANKIRAEHNNPRADIFWASTVLQSQMLANEKQLAPYHSPSAQDVPDGFKDPQGYWTAIGIRARILVATKPSQQKSLAFTPKNLAGKFAISNPHFGTCTDWVSAYGSRWGKARTLAFFEEMKKAGVRILPGNADVALGVAEGNLEYGIVDTDDFLAQKRENKSIYLVKTTQDNVLVPGSASLVAGAPHRENARKLLDALLSAQSEQELIHQMPGMFSVRHVREANNWKSGGEDFSYLKDTPTEDTAKWLPVWQALRKPLADM
ncbi:hypothetical protein EON80_32045, partial [bacterium]